MRNLFKRNNPYRLSIYSYTYLYKAIYSCEDLHQAITMHNFIKDLNKKQIIDEDQACSLYSNLKSFVERGFHAS